MFEISQGEILSVDKLPFPVLVVSKNFFNQSQQAIVCPIQKEAAADPLHIFIETDMLSGFVLCEQLRLLDLRVRGYKKTAEIKMETIMDISDALQGIFDYY